MPWRALTGATRSRPNAASSPTTPTSPTRPAMSLGWRAGVVMTRDRAWFLDLWSAQPGLRRGYLLDLALAVSIGAVLLIGGRERTTAAAWATLNLNGGPL